MVKNISKILCLLMFAAVPSIVLADVAASEANPFPVSTEQSKRVALAPITIPLKNSPKPTSFGRPILFYANNQPFNQPFILEHGQIFARIEDAASALRLKMERQGETICISENGFSGNTCPSNNSSAGLVYINGKSVPESALLNAGETWVEVSTLARSLGYRYAYNKQTKIADLSAPVPLYLALAPEPNQEPLGKSQQKISPQDKVNDEEMPLKIEVLDSFQRNWTGVAQFANNDLKHPFRVTNISEKEVKNVVATLSYSDGHGGSNAAGGIRIYNIGTLQPGQSVTEENATGYQISMVVVGSSLKLEWLGKNGKTASWQDDEKQPANADNDTLFVRPKYAETFPDLQYPTEGTVSPSLVRSSSFSVPVAEHPSPINLDHQTEGSINPEPAIKSDVEIPIATTATTSSLSASPASASFIGSPANATLPATSAPSLLVETQPWSDK